jgi:hypothetical protein
LAEWLFEHGVGEDRALLIERGQVLAARVEWPGSVRPGTIADARLVSKAAGLRRGLAQLADGTEVLVDKLPAEVSEGQTVRIEITRAALAERGRNKRAQGRPAPVGAVERAGPDLLATLKASGLKVQQCRPGDRVFSDFGWEELVEEALTGAVAFAGGSLLVSATPAMTLIDIDGDLPPARLALAAVPAIAETLRRLDIAGSVGIDFPTIEAKKDRQEIDLALAHALNGWQGERTAMNGFGFVQLVSRLERPSILSLYQRFPLRVAAISLARQAEAVTAPGALLLSANPGLKPHLPGDFDTELQRRTARKLRWNWDPALALDAAFAQAITP